MYIRFYLLFAGVFMLAGCSASDRCRDSIEEEDYAAAVLQCQVRFKQDGSSHALAGWINALGKLGRSGEMPKVIAELKDNSRRAEAMMTAAGYLSKQGEQGLAQDYYRLSIELFRSLGDGQSLSVALNRVFNIEWRKSNHRAALEYAAEALDVARRDNDSKAELTALTNLFTVLEEVGNLGSAQHVMTLMKEMISADENSSRGVVTVAHNNQGLLYLNTQQYGLAVRSFDLGLLSAQGSENTRFLRGLRLNAARANAELGRLDTAAEHMAMAWSYADSDGSTQFALWIHQALLYLREKKYQLAHQTVLRALDDPELPSVWLRNIYHWAGEASDGMGDKQAAIAFYKKAINATEAMREELGYNQLKAHLHSRQRESYEALFIDYFETDRPLEALAVSEQAKSANFIQNFIQTDETELALATRSFPYQAVSDRIDGLQQFLASMALSSVVAEQEIGDAINSLGNKTVLSFFLANQRLFVIQVAGSKLQIDEIAATDDELQSLLYVYKGNPADEATLTKFGALLLPGHMLPVRGEHLFISPDGFIGQLAIASLRVNSEYLIERNSISLVPSISTLSKLVNQEQHLPIGIPSSLVLSDPDGDLPAARQEALEVADMLKVKPYTGSAASFSRLLEIDRLEIFHMASHSGFDHLGPWLKFSDGAVAATQIMQEKIRPQLAMLASCGSGVPHSDNLWGSLGGAFLSNGTSSAVVTLWSVEDELARRMTSRFYRQLTAGETSAESLAAAQRLAIAENEAPHKWGAFAVMGVPRSLLVTSERSIIGH